MRIFHSHCLFFMSKESPSRQLRRCGSCKKAGHNKATCPVVVLPSAPTSTTPPPAPVSRTPLKFFVHHVSHASAASPYVIDMRHHKKEVWKNVTAAAPVDSQNPLYHYYHKLPSAPERLFAQSVDQDLDQDQASPSRFDSLKPISHLQQMVTACGEWWHDKKEKVVKRAIVIASPAQAGRGDPTDYRALSENEGIVLIPKDRGSRSPRDHRTRNDTLLSRLITKQNFKLRWALAVIVLVIILPRASFGYVTSLKDDTNEITAQSLAGFASLKNSTDALRGGNISLAEETTDLALKQLNKAASLLQTKHGFLATVAAMLPRVGNNITSKENVLLAGADIALGNSYLFSSLGQGNIAPGATLLGHLQPILAGVKATLPHYQAAQKKLARVDISVLPAEHQADFANVKKVVNAISHDLEVITELAGPLKEFLGQTGRRRFLLVFQNQHELRPTGGFMGSFAVIEVKDGQLLSFKLPPGGSYDLQGQLNAYVKPPTPLLLANKRWEFQDANWFPDFPASADKMLWFYRHSRGVTLDGVIAINGTVLERLLSVLGPLTDNSRSLTLSAESALPILEKIIETGPEKTANTPKQILADLAPNLLDTIQKAPLGSLLGVLHQLENALEQKEIQLYNTDEEAESALVALGWSGAVPTTRADQDFLMAINTNIQGEKSDSKIKQNISHQAVVEENGTITNTVTIMREHTGAFGEKLYGTANIDYLRLYVPKGSALISVSGFSWPNETLFRVPDPWAVTDAALTAKETEIGIEARTGTRVTEEFGKTAFGNWIITEPGATSRIEFVYKLPFTAFQNERSTSAQAASYQLVVGRQSGSESKFDSQIIFPDGWRPVWQDGSDMVPASNGGKIPSQPLERDTVWSLLMKK